MFLEKAKQKLEEHGWMGTKNPWDLIDNWCTFVEDCKGGYNFCIYEYDNDLSVRNALEVLLQDKELKIIEGYADLEKIVHEIDAKFKGLLQDNAIRPEFEKWWVRGVLKYADEDYVKDIKDLYGIEVEKIN